MGAIAILSDRHAEFTMPKRKQTTQNPGPLTIEQALLSHPMVKSHLTYLGENGADQQIILGLLVIFARLAGSPSKEDWAHGSGKAGITLKRFPRQLENWANDIEGMDAHPLLDLVLGAHALWPAESVQMRNTLAHDMRKLPLLIRFRANLLRWQIRFIQDLFQRARREHQSVPTSLKLIFLTYINLSTGIRHLSSVAELLTAAHATTGSTRIVTEYSLEKLWERYSYLQPRLEKRLAQRFGPAAKH